MAKVAITGNTYPVKDQLKALGARWDADGKVWMIDESKLEQARAIVNTAPTPTPPVPGVCVKCKGRVKPPYVICYACKNVGKCLNCGASLGSWERQHGVKRCGDCRDGGGNAHGGQSYYDRHGNFVLGDDD